MLAKGRTMITSTPSVMSAPAVLLRPPIARASFASVDCKTAASTPASRSGAQKGETTQRKRAVAKTARMPTAMRPLRGLRRAEMRSSGGCTL